MTFGVLGPLEVAPAHVSGRNLRTLLAALLLRPNRAVSTTDLVDRLWSAETAPHAPLRVLQTNVVRLRRLLGPDAIATTPGGYRIVAGPDELDLLRFERLLAAASASGDPVEEAAILRRALALWRGPVVADVDSRVIQAYDVPAIAERRLAALERRVELDVRLGNDDALVPELRALVAEHPMRERFWKWLMVALSRQGRQADALDAYRTLAHRLVDELGIEPGAQLREVHQRILRGADPIPVGPSTVAAARAVVPRQLPPDDPQFQGRAGAFAALTAAMRAGLRTVVVDGPAGVGKTALAVRWSTGVADDFPDGQLYVNLRGFHAEPPLNQQAALRVLLDGVGAPNVPDDPDSAAGLFRTLTAGRRILVVLDNARDADQVRPLLPGPGGLAVVTSRDQLRGLVARDGARRVSLGPLDPVEAARITPNVGGGFPLALRIAAERAARLPYAGADELPDELRTALSWSYAALDASTARVFRALGDPDRRPDPADARQLDRLVEVHLVEQDAAGRYRLLEPVRAFAAELRASARPAARRLSAVP